MFYTPFSFCFRITCAENGEDCTVLLTYGGGRYNPFEEWDPLPVRILRAAAGEVSHAYEEGQNRLEMKPGVS